MSDTQIDLRWEAPNNTGGVAITGYQLQVSEDGTTFTDLHRTNGTTLSYEHRGLSGGATRHYQVAAINSVGSGTYASPVSATTYDRPAIPVALAATPVSDTQINLRWEAPTNTGGATITGYQLQFSTNGTVFNNLSRTPGSTTTYQHTGLTRGTTYYYQVSAINSVDQGAYSSSVSTTTHDLPGVPRGLTATPVDDTQINLSWRPPTSTGGTAITGYKIQFSSPDASNFTDLRTTSGSTTTYQHTGLMNGTTYYYQVAAINRVDRGALSTTASATTPVVPPVAPTNLTATPVDDTKINLSWQPPTNTGGAEITGYKIQFSSPDASNFTDLRTISGSTTTYQHTGLTRGTTYYYQVAAINSVDQGAYSSFGLYYDARLARCAERLDSYACGRHKDKPLLAASYQHRRHSYHGLQDTVLFS